ncbi:hypothetical protein LguiA_003009 [Lonicera macranthoides]
MDSPEMDAPPSNVVVKIEDVVSTFVEYLIDPLLPSYMVEEAPLIVKQQNVAKQVLLEVQRQTLALHEIQSFESLDA